MSIIEIKKLKDKNNPTAAVRFGVYVNGKREADCAKLSTAVNSAAEVFKGALNGVCPAHVVVAGTQGKKWEAVERVEKEPEYEEEAFDTSALVAELKEGDNTEGVKALTEAPATAAAAGGK